MAIKLAYQIYSARDIAEKDLKGVLEKVAELGYDGVEYAGMYGNPVEKVAEWTRAAGLSPVSSHVPYDQIKENMDKVISDHKILGCPYIAVPFLGEDDRPGAAGFAAAVRIIAEFGRKCAAAGITLIYHNHDFEFAKVSGIYGLDFLYDAVSPEFLSCELDTCWINVAGENPVAYIEKYAGRCPVVHLKDFVGEKGDGPLYSLINSDGSDDVKIDAKDVKADDFAFRPVGYGVQDMPAIIAAGVKAGADWFVVEQDLSYEIEPLTAAKMSCEYVRKNS